jgi:hypothetical protein
MVDPHHDLRASWAAATRPCQLDKGIKGVSLGPFPTARFPRNLEGFVRKGLERCHDSGPLFDSAPGVQVERTFGVHVVAQRTRPVHRSSTCFGVLSSRSGAPRLLR